MMIQDILSRAMVRTEYDSKKRTTTIPPQSGLNRQYIDVLISAIPELPGVRGIIRIPCLPNQVWILSAKYQRFVIPFIGNKWQMIRAGTIQTVKSS